MAVWRTSVVQCCQSAETAACAAQAPWTSTRRASSRPSSVGQQPAEAVAEAAEDVVAVAGAGGVDPAGLPADHVEPAELGGHVLGVVDGHQHAPLGPRLADVPPLDVAREDDQGSSACRISRVWMCPSAQ